MRAPSSWFSRPRSWRLTNVRLRDASESLSRKLNATTVNVRTGGGAHVVGRTRFGPTERRVLGLLPRPRRCSAAPIPPPVPTRARSTRGRAATPCSAAPASSSPATPTCSRPVATGASTLLRRGTPDPHRSLVVVPTTTFANTAGAAARPRPATGRRPSARPRGSAPRRSRSASCRRSRTASPSGRCSAASGSGSRAASGAATSRARCSRPRTRVVLSRLVGGDSPATQVAALVAHGRAEAAPFWPGLFTALDSAYKVDHRDPARQGLADVRERPAAGRRRSAPRGSRPATSGCSPTARRGAWARGSAC